MGFAGMEGGVEGEDQVLMRVGVLEGDSCFVVGLPRGDGGLMVFVTKKRTWDSKAVMMIG